MTPTVSSWVRVLLTWGAVASPAISSTLPAQGAPDSAQGALVLLPAHPRPGQPFRLTYRGALARGVSPTLTVRARFRTVHDIDPPAGMTAESLGVLRRVGPHVYAATLRLADTVPYAALAVATPDGAAVDDRGGRAWPLLTGDVDGAPTFRARITAAYDFLGRDFGAGFREAARAVAMAPDSIWGWYMLDFYGAAQFGDAYVDSVRAERLPTLAALERRFGGAAGALEAYGYASLAQLLGDTARARVWEERFLRAAPGLRYQRERRAAAIVQRLRGQPAQALDSLDQLWAELDAPEPGVALFAVRQAIAAGDTARLGVWSARYARGVPAREATVAALTARNPVLRPLGAGRLAALRALPLDTRLGGVRLADTRAMHLRHAAAQDRWLAESLAKARLALGDSAAALVLLDSVSRASTDTALLGLTGHLALARADTATATRAFAYLTELAGGSVVVPRAATSSPAWPAATRAARRAIDSLILAAAVSRPVPALMARDVAGRRRTLARDSATVVVYWSATCPFSRALLPQLPALARRVRALGGRFQLVADAAPSARHATLLREAGLGGEPSLFDADRDVARALSAWVVPTIHVLDASGRLRFTMSSAEEVPRQLAALVR